jgi:hypothetical protein
MSRSILGLQNACTHIYEIAEENGLQTERLDFSLYFWESMVSFLKMKKKKAEMLYHVLISWADKDSKAVDFARRLSSLLWFFISSALLYYYYYLQQ